MIELTLRETQIAELDVLSRVAAICEEQGLRYYLTYGTLIGAIRHKGFIPWDDDIDIAMPRSDYQKLLVYWKNNAQKLSPLELFHYTTNKQYIYPIIRISDSRYVADYEGVVNYGLGAFIDIYPIDGSGNNEIEAEKIWKANQNDILVILSGGGTRFELSKYGCFRSIIKFLLYKLTRVFGLRMVLRHVDKRSRKHSFESSYLSYCTVWGSSYKYAQPKTDYDEWIYVEFEGQRFRTYKNYDEALRRIYGDYMTLPPEEKRVGHHSYKLFRKE